MPKVPVKVTRYWRFLGRTGDRPTMPAVAFQLFVMDAYEPFSELFNRHVHSASVVIPTHFDSLKSGRSMERIMVQVRRLFLERPDLADRMLQDLDETLGTRLDAKRRNHVQSLIEMYRHSDEQLLNFYGPPGTVFRIPFHALVKDPEEPFRESHICRT